MKNDTLAYAIENRRSTREYSEKAAALDDVHQLIWAAQGTTGEEDKRTVPSAHALYPLNFLVTAGKVEGLDQGVYAVSAKTGELAPLIGKDVRSSLRTATVGDQEWVGLAPLIITICADYVEPCRAFADQKPYGRRGQMYVALEAGAAAQNIMLQATRLGLGSVLVAGIDDEMTSAVFALKAPFTPVLHICIGWPAEPPHD